MTQRKITDVFFDLDHTLWDFDKNSALTFQKIFTTHNLSVPFDDFIKIYEPINLNYWKLYREERIDKPSLRYGRLKDSFDLLNFKVEDELIHILSEDYIKYLTTFNHLFDGALEILIYLNTNYKLHIITNGFEEAQYRKIKNSKIDHFFKTVTNSEMVGVKKPNPLIFNHALSLAQTSPEQSVMIGDNLEADILGAMNVGFDVILFNHHRVTVDASIKKVDTLLQIKNYL
jgi:putative hydrolase of the HAD superfamily